MESLRHCWHGKHTRRRGTLRPCQQTQPISPTSSRSRRRGRAATPRPSSGRAPLTPSVASRCSRLRRGTRRCRGCAPVSAALAAAGRRGRARPIFSYEVPAADDLPAAAPAPGGVKRAAGLGRQAGPGPSCKDLRHHERRCAALGLPAGGPTRGRDYPPRDHRMADFSIFGSKTDTIRAGQAAVLPSSDARNSGTRALLEGSRAGLLRLAALPPLALQQVASRFRASRSRSANGRTSSPTGPRIS